MMQKNLLYHAFTCMHCFHENWNIYLTSRIFVHSTDLSSSWRDRRRMMMMMAMYINICWSCGAYSYVSSLHIKLHLCLYTMHHYCKPAAGVGFGIYVKTIWTKFKFQTSSNFPHLLYIRCVFSIKLLSLRIFIYWLI